MSIEEHYTNVLSKISTADLVQELCSRKEVDEWSIEPKEVFRFYFPGSGGDHRGVGPATILVIERVPE